MSIPLIFERMLDHYGSQYWWPADTPFEVMVGAVLTQATAWTNVERAIARLKEADALSPAAMRAMDTEALAALIYSSGFYNSKALRLKELTKYLRDAYNDDIEVMRQQDGAKLRRELLRVRGIGEETADAILLYALGKPSFVIDAYTRRLFRRLGIVPEAEAYNAYQRMFSDSLTHNAALFAENSPQDTTLFAENSSQDTTLFAEYHALIVRHCKEACRKTPLCETCCLRDICPTSQAPTFD